MLTASSSERLVKMRSHWLPIASIESTALTRPLSSFSSACALEAVRLYTSSGGSGGDISRMCLAKLAPS